MNYQGWIMKLLTHEVLAERVCTAEDYRHSS